MLFVATIGLVISIAIAACLLRVARRRRLLAAEQPRMTDSPVGGPYRLPAVPCEPDAPRYADAEPDEPLACAGGRGATVYWDASSSGFGSSPSSWGFGSGSVDCSFGSGSAFDDDWRWAEERGRDEEWRRSLEERQRQRREKARHDEGRRAWLRCGIHDAENDW